MYANPHSISAGRLDMQFCTLLSIRLYSYVRNLAVVPAVTKNRETFLRLQLHFPKASKLNVADLLTCQKCKQLQLYFK
jgi:hypothetical protein